MLSLFHLIQCLPLKRNQLPLRAQETTDQAPGARPHQGSHTAGAPERRFPGNLYRWRGAPDTD